MGLMNVVPRSEKELQFALAFVANNHAKERW
jgi:hypothetical protein